MSIIEEVSDGLAKRTLEVMQKTGDETVEKRISDEIGASSPTLQEAYQTAMRLRKAELRGYALLSKYEVGDEIPAAAISAQPQDDGGH